MIITWTQGSSELWYNCIMIPCSCNVKNEINGKRAMDKIVYTIPNHKPYMPRIFPKGMWKVGLPEVRETKDRAPYFIPTTAYQLVQVWNTLNDNYVSPSEILDKDEGYGLHFSEYDTTLGCIKIRNVQDLLSLVQEIRQCFKRKEDVYVTVS